MDRGCDWRNSGVANETIPTILRKHNIMPAQKQQLQQFSLSWRRFLLHSCRGVWRWPSLGASSSGYDGMWRIRSSLGVSDVAVPLVAPFRWAWDLSALVPGWAFPCQPDCGVRALAVTWCRPFQRGSCHFCLNSSRRTLSHRVDDVCSPAFLFPCLEKSVTKTLSSLKHWFLLLDQFLLYGILDWN